MATCKYCGKKAGFLRSAHKQCRQANEQGIIQIIQLITDNSTKDSASSIKDSILTLAQASHIDKAAFTAACIKGWENAVSKALEDDVLTAEEEQSLVQVKDALELSQEQLDKNGAYLKLVKATIIRELLEGKIPQVAKIDGNIPFNLQKNEQIVWLFNDAKYYEERTYTRYGGAYSGVSIRVMKGVYYRTGAFKGNPVVTSNIVHIDDGQVAITDKHIYFAGSKKAFRVPYNKIVAFKPYNDGLGIQRDAQSAKPQIFVVDDGWFIHNLVVNLSKLEKA